MPTDTDRHLLAGPTYAYAHYEVIEHPPPASTPYAYSIHPSVLWTDEQLRTEVSSLSRVALLRILRNNQFVYDQMGPRWVAVCRARIAELDSARVSARFWPGPDAECLA